MDGIKAGKDGKDVMGVKDQLLKFVTDRKGWSIDSLRPAIFEEIKKRLAAERAQKEQTINGIKHFLEYRGVITNGLMDDCLRWHILVEALKFTQHYPEAAKVTSEIIVNTCPMLAFVCLDTSEDKSSDKLKRFYVEQCKQKNFHKSFQDTIPFRLAVSSGNHSIVNLMISTITVTLDDAQIKNNLDHPLNKKTVCDLVEARDESSDPSPLTLAQTARYTPLETLEELLKVPGITDSEGTSFNQALDKGWDRVVETFLKHDIGKPTTSAPIIKALNLLNKSVDLGRVGTSVRSQNGDWRLNIVKSLVCRAKFEAFDKEVVKSVIEQDLTEVWKVWRKEHGKDQVKKAHPWLLHMAVLHEKVEFVKMFVDDYPDALSKEEDIPDCHDPKTPNDRYPLWYNNRKWYKGKNETTGRFDLRPPTSDADPCDRRAIRNLIVTKMIHELDMDKLPDILHRSNEPFDDLCFDISRFNSAAYRISDIVDSLILQDEPRGKEKGRGMHRYEHTLKYVAFPPLDTMVAEREAYAENLNLKKGHDEVFRVLNWLQRKKVTKIIKLTVPDRLVNPHDDTEMAKFVKEFKIEVLDWKVLDLSISIFKSKDPKEPTELELKELYLYSSGKRAAINHWFNKDDGVQSLRKLEKLYVHVIKETCTASQAKSLLHDIRLQNQDLADEESPIAPIDPIEVAWYPSPSVADLSKIAYQLSRPLADWLTKLASFVNNKRKVNGKVTYKPTKVAILDNGVLSISPVSREPDAEISAKTKEEKTNEENTGPEVASTGVIDSKLANSTPLSKPKGGKDDENSLWSRIKAGRSFVDGNLNFSPWQFPSDPHGTQMANLVCAIDPFCEIYVARVAEDAFGIKAENVTKAIQWAMDEKVDIISMSFVLGEDPGHVMENKIIQAGEAGIVMTCSTHDEGSRIAKAYPADSKQSCQALLVLAACDEYGKLLREIDLSSYNYKLRGQNVPAGVVPFIKSEEKISGSSVATALAAGLCSLILTCARLAKPDRTFDDSVKVHRNDGDPSDTSRLGVVLKHLKVMLSGSGSIEQSHHLLLEKFGGIAQPSPGEGTKHAGLVKAGNSGPPSAEMVLQEHFGMELQ